MGGRRRPDELVSDNRRGTRPEPDSSVPLRAKPGLRGDDQPQLQRVESCTLAHDNSTKQVAATGELFHVMVGILVLKKCLCEMCAGVQKIVLNRGNKRSEDVLQRLS